MFSTPDLTRKTKDEAVHYYSRSRVELFVSVIITSIIFVLLVAPVVIMYKMTSMGHSEHWTFTAIGVLIVFTFLFSGAMGTLTVARRHEIFAASAAYCAVLVVFISNFSNT
jgi:quinol-cytochrome oxidoreductase complex cytochrome b subunit